MLTAPRSPAITLLSPAADSSSISERVSQSVQRLETARGVDCTGCREFPAHSSRNNCNISRAIRSTRARFLHVIQSLFARCSTCYCHPTSPIPNSLLSSLRFTPHPQLGFTPHPRLGFNPHPRLTVCCNPRSQGLPDTSLLLSTSLYVSRHCSRTRAVSHTCRLSTCLELTAQFLNSLL